MYYQEVWEDYIQHLKKWIRLMTNEFNVRYTNKDIVDKINEVKESIARLTEHVKQTNGRVSTLESSKNKIWTTLISALVVMMGWIITIVLRTK